MSEPRDNVLSVRTANIVMLLSLGAYMGFGILASRIAFLGNNELLRIALGEVCLALPGFIALRVKKINIRGFTECHEPEGHSFRMAFSAVLCTYPIVIIINLISLKFVQNTVAQVLPQTMVYGYLPMLLVMAVLPAIIEEFVFRGVMFHSYREVSVPGAVFLSALLFGLMHLNLNQMPYAFVLGLVLAAMVQASGSLETSMFMHFLFNGTSVTLNYFSAAFSRNVNTDPQEGAAVREMMDTLFEPLSIVLMICIIASMSVFLFLIIRKTARSNGRSMRGRGKGHLIDVWIILFICAAAFLTVRNTMFV